MYSEYALKPEENHVVDQLTSDKGLFISDVLLGLSLMVLLFRSQEIMTLTIEQEMVQDGISPYYWTPAASISAVMIIYTLVHAIMLSDGFFKTCKQYRNEVVKNVHATGNMVGVIQGRLSCSAIFDFMDYLHPDLSFERRRDYRINTSIPLIMAVIASWVSVGCWIGALVINIMRARASRRVRI